MEPPPLSVLLIRATAIKVYCLPCNRCRRFEPWEALAKFGPDANVFQMAAKCRCAKCGAKAVEARPEYPKAARGG
jgi:hypothetical protein